MPIQRWRCPVALQVKWALFAAAGVALARVFFPLWFAVPVMAVFGVWGLGVCARRIEVLVDPDTGLIVVRVGPLTRRIRLANVTAVQVDRAKVSIARSDGGEISFYAWRKSRLDGWLRVPVVAGDVAHAISRAAAGAREAHADDAARPARTSPWSRQRLGLTLLACIGVVALGAAFLVRVSWPNPVMTMIGVVLALALGVSGILYVLAALWLLLKSRQSRGQASAA